VQPTPGTIPGENGGAGFGACRFTGRHCHFLCIFAHPMVWNAIPLIFLIED
jgi:hypothetical protein